MNTYRLLVKLLDWLQLDSSDSRLSAATCLGFLLGFTPLASLQGILLLAMVIALRVNLATTLVSFVFFSLLSAPFDPLFHLLGFAILTPPGLHRLWSGLYHAPIFPYTRFNNTIVMGRALFSVAFVAPLFLTVRALIAGHRKAITQWIQRNPIWEVWTSTRLYRLYANYYQRR